MSQLSTFQLSNIRHKNFHSTPLSFVPLWGTPLDSERGGLKISDWRLIFFNNKTKILGLSPLIFEEFLIVTLTRFCDRTKFSWIHAKSWDVYTQTRKVMHFYHFLYIFAPFMWLLEYFSYIFFAHFFLKLSVDRAKNVLLECLNLW